MGVLSGNAKAPGHLAETCQDDYCTRLPCRMFKRGYQAGLDRGRQEGYDKGWGEGYQAGYGAGFPAGAASCK